MANKILSNQILCFDLYAKNFEFAALVSIMSDVVLAHRYSPENYPIALDNLAKRYSKDGGEPINYTEVGFGQISEDQASHTLRFFADIGLVDNPKGANYVPPEAVINWRLKMGNVKEQARAEVQTILEDYEVFDEIKFVLDEGSMDLKELATQVGGIVGIDEDELKDMKRTIRVFGELGFFSVGEDNMVSMSNSVEESVPSETNSAPRSHTKQDVSRDPQSVEIEYETPDEVVLNLDVRLNIDNLAEDELQRKLEIVRDVFEKNSIED